MHPTVGRRLKSGTLILAALFLGACSKPQSDAPAAAAPAPAATPAPAPAPAPVAAPIEPHLLARLARADSPVLGRVDAPVTIVEFLDPACEACRAYAPVVKQILFLYPEDVRVVVRFAAFHPGSDEAIRVIEAARKQGKFAEVLGALFDRQPEWASHSGPNPARTWDIAAENGVDLAKARSHPGMVDGSTMMFEANTSGNRKVKPSVITVVGVLMRSPSTMKIQPMPKPMVNSIRKAETTPTKPASGR